MKGKRYKIDWISFVMVPVTVFSITEALLGRTISCNTSVMVISITHPLQIFLYFFRVFCNIFVTFLNDFPDIQTHKGHNESIHWSNIAADSLNYIVSSHSISICSKLYPKGRRNYKTITIIFLYLMIVKKRDKYVTEKVKVQVLKLVEDCRTYPSDGAGEGRNLKMVEHFVPLVEG